jgi:hypothetical protein
MRRSFLALLSVVVMSLQLSLPLVLALGVDPCANAGDHACPPQGDDCHDCARCSPQPAILPTSVAVTLDVIPLAEGYPTIDVAARPPEAPRARPMRVPRSLA